MRVWGNLEEGLMACVLPNRGTSKREDKLLGIQGKDHLLKYILSFKGYIRRALVLKTNILIQDLRSLPTLKIYLKVNYNR